MEMSANPESAGSNQVGGWVSPEPQQPTSGRRRLLIGGLVVAAMLFVGYLGLIFLGGQVLHALRGTAEFGTSGSGCVVHGRSSTFPRGTDLYIVAYVSRDIALGEPVSLHMTQDGQDAGHSGSRPDLVLAAGDCLAGPLRGEDTLVPAHYRFEYLVGSETIAVGEFDIAP